MADDLKRVGLKLTADGAQDFKAALKDCTAATKENYSELKLAQSQYDKNTTSVQKLQDRQKYLQNQTEIYSDKVKILNTQLEIMESDENKDEAAIAKKRAELNQAQAALNGYESSLKEVNEQLKNHSAQLKEWGDRLKDAGDKIQNVGDKVKGVGDTLTTHVTAPIVAVGTASATMAMDFETSMAKLSTIADTETVPIKDLEQAILDLSNQSGVSASEIAENVYGAISAGQDTADAVNYVGDAMKLAKAGFADTGAALDVLTTITNAYGMSADEAAHISDVLITTQNQGKTTVGELASSMGKIIPTANMFGVNLENISAGYVTMTKNGVATAESTTYMNSMLNELGKSGTKSSEILKNRTGKSFAELMNSGYSLTDVLQILKDEADENGQSMADMFGSAEAGKAAATLIQHIDDFNGALQDMTDTSREAGEVTNEAFQKVDSTNAEQLKKTLNELKNTGIELGTTLLEMLAPAMDWLKEKVSQLRTWWESLDESQKKQVISIAGIAAAVGPVLSVIGTLITTIGGIVWAIGVLVPAIGLIASPVGIVIAIIGALIAVGVLLYKNWDTICAWAAQLRDNVVAAWEELKSNVSQLVETLKTAVVETWEALKTAVITAVETVRDNAIKAWEELKSNVSQLVETLKTAVVETWEALKTAVTTAVETVRDNIIKAWEAAKETVSTVIETIRTTVTDTWEEIKRTVSTVVETIRSTIVDGFENARDTVTGVFESIYTAITEKLTWARDFVFGIIEEIKGFFNFEWSLPDIQLPQIPQIPIPHVEAEETIELPFGIEIPDPRSLSVTWNADAYDRAAYYTRPTVRADGLGFGDRQGGEFAVGESHLREVIRDESGNSQLVPLIEMIINLISNRTPTNLIINQAPGEDTRELAREVAELINMDFDKEEAVFA